MSTVLAKFAFAVACLGLATARPSQATAPNPMSDPAFNPLRVALVTAWQQHPAAQAAEANLLAARARARAARQPLYNPQLELAADDEGPDRLRTISLSQTLDLSGKRRARSALGDTGIVLGEAVFTLQRIEFAHDWLVGLTQVLATTRRVGFGEQRVTFATRLAELAERQFLAGDISAPERDLVLLARDEAFAEQAGLLVDAAAAREAFAKKGGTNGQTSLELPRDAPPAPMTAGALDIRESSQWRVAAAEAQIAERRVIVAERDRRPDPTISLRGGKIRLAEGISDNVIGVSVSVPLFFRNSYRAEVEAARADADSADAVVRVQMLELQARAESSTAAYMSTREAWLKWMRSRGTNLDVRSNALERLWTAGEMSTTDYVLQLKQTLDTALAGAALEGRVWQSYFDYLYAVGQLDDWIGTGNEP